jgi:hypothetical protein
LGPIGVFPNIGTFKLPISTRRGKRIHAALNAGADGYILYAIRAEMTGGQLTLSSGEWGAGSHARIVAAGHRGGGEAGGRLSSAASSARYIELLSVSRLEVVML